MHSQEVYNSNDGLASKIGLVLESWMVILMYKHLLLSANIPIVMFVFEYAVVYM